jgi:hypothetical protein
MTMLLPRNLRAKSSKKPAKKDVQAMSPVVQYADRAGQPGDADNDESEALPTVVEHEL